ncbi:MAG: tetratricopeptide repeat protein, partial [Elusimicrobiota bacterium]|nr:tetratricopeptide repeat protein [Elusimicrobiota bacterium]
ASGYLSSSAGKEKVLYALRIYAVLVSLLDIIWPWLAGRTLFLNPNIKAGLYLMVIPLFFPLIINSFKSRKIAPLLPVLIVISAFLKTRSFIAGGVLLLCAVFYIYARDYKKSAAGLLALTGVASILAFYKYPEISMAAAQRWEWIQAGLRMAAEKPCTGFGMGAVPHVITAFMHKGPYSLYIHSAWLRFAAECGAPAAVALLIFLILLLKGIFMSNDRRNRIVSLSLGAVILYNFFEYNIYIPLNGLLFAFLLGTFSKKPGLNLTLKNKTLRRISGAALIALTLAAAVYFVKPFTASRNFTRGAHLLKTGRSLEALNHFERALSQYPGYPLAKLGLAHINLENGNFLKAARLLSETFSKPYGGPAYRAYRNGIEFLGKGNTLRGKTELRRAVRIRMTQYGIDPAYYLPGSN